MNKKNVGLAVLSLVLIYMGYSYWSKVQKDKWAQERPEIKYSEAREKEVWGGVLWDYDAGLYYGTPLYDLANEMSSYFDFFKNQDKIERLISEIPKGYINYQEGKYGLSIGHFALNTSNISAIRLLLDRGLNPCLMDKRSNAIIIDINKPFISRSPEGMKTLKYMIKKGAELNIHSEKAYNSALIEAASYNIENVKVLVNAGANPHFIKEVFSDDHSYSSYISPLVSALMNERIDIVNYLIFDQKVDFRSLKYPSGSKFHPNECQILYKLRDMTFELNTKDYQEKMKLVAYLKTQGLDYKKTPIPENISTNPHYGNKEYLSKY